MGSGGLTGRQRRERQFYDEYARRTEPKTINFDILRSERRAAWNSSWYVYDLLVQAYRAGARKLLDFGCGGGINSVRFSRLGYEVWGFDLSPNSIAIARRLARKYNAEGRTHFSVQPAERLDYPSAFFDIVVGFDILHHIEIEPGLRQCLRVLKKGGVAIFREHVEVPIYDAIRKSRWGRWLVPQGPSLDRHVTQDERKLTADDLALIENLCPRLCLKRFAFLSRLDLFTGRPSFLARVDQEIFKRWPSCRRYGGVIVLVLRNDPKQPTTSAAGPSFRRMV